MVEQLTLNQWVEGSSPSGDTEKRGLEGPLFYFVILSFTILSFILSFDYFIIYLVIFIEFEDAVETDEDEVLLVMEIKAAVIENIGRIASGKEKRIVLGAFT